MTCVGVDYASRLDAHRDRESTRPPFEYKRQHEGLIMVTSDDVRSKEEGVILYDCDHAEWFAVIDDEGARVVKPWRTWVKDRRPPWERVVYGSRTDLRPYFAGNLEGGGYCVVTAGLASETIRILEVRDGMHLAWKEVGVSNDPLLNERVPCEFMVGGGTVVYCQLTETGLIVGKRTLVKSGDAWEMRPWEELSRHLESWHDMTICRVCAVPRQGGGFHVFCTLKHERSSAFLFVAMDTTARTHRTRTSQNHIQMRQCRRQVYATLNGVVTNVTTMTPCVDVDPSYTPGGFCTLPGFGVLISKNDSHDVDHLYMANNTLSTKVATVQGKDNIMLTQDHICFGLVCGEYVVCFDITEMVHGFTIYITFLRCFLKKNDTVLAPLSASNAARPIHIRHLSGDEWELEDDGDESDTAPL